MDTDWSWIRNRVAHYGLCIGAALGLAVLGGFPGEAAGSEGGDPASPDRSSWALQRADQLPERASKLLGIERAAILESNASLVTLAEDNTPYLNSRLVGKPLWHVEVRNLALDLPSSPAGHKDPYVRTFDMFLDPEEGKMLKIKSRWPQGAAPSAPEPSAAFAAMQMLSGDREKYHGFPDQSPPISFVEALDAIQRGGGSPLAAKQIVGLWVLWSEFDKPPQAVWVITLRGIFPMETAYPGVPVDSRNHLRYIVDPVAKRWIIATTTPQPEASANE